MAIKGYVFIKKPALVGTSVEGRCDVVYGPFQFDLTDVPVQLNPNDSVTTEIDRYQQKALDTIGAEAALRNVPNPILSLNEIRVISTISK